MSKGNTKTNITIANIFPATANGQFTVTLSGYDYTFASWITSYKFCRLAPEAVWIFDGSVNVTEYFILSSEIPVFKYSFIVPSGSTTDVNDIPLLIIELAS